MSASDNLGGWGDEVFGVDVWVDREANKSVIEKEWILEQVV